MDRAVSDNWLKRAVYVLLAMLILFLHLLPLDTRPDRWPFPEILVALTFAWVVRRPDYVPTILIAVVMLLADLLLQRPPGLLAALVVLGAAYLRTATPNMRDVRFLGEWMSVAVVMTLIFLINRVILSILSVEQSAIGPVAIQLVLTIMAYPPIVLISQSVLGVRRMTTAEANVVGAQA